MTDADHFILGDYNASCYECGRKRKASELRRHWRGYYVCLNHWEPRHPQDFVGVTPNQSSIPWSQPQNDLFIAPFPEPIPFDPNNP